MTRLHFLTQFHRRLKPAGVTLGHHDAPGRAGGERAIDEVAHRGGKLIDTRTKIGKALMAWRGELVADLGGAEQLSTQPSDQAEEEYQRTLRARKPALEASQVASAAKKARSRYMRALGQGEAGADA